MPTWWARVSSEASADCIRLASSADLRFAGRLIFVGLINATAQIEEEIERSGNVNHGENDQNPFASIARFPVYFRIGRGFIGPP